MKRTGNHRPSRFPVAAAKRGKADALKENSTLYDRAQFVDTPPPVGSCISGGIPSQKGGRGGSPLTRASRGEGMFADYAR